MAANARSVDRVPALLASLKTKHGENAALLTKQLEDDLLWLHGVVLALRVQKRLGEEVQELPSSKRFHSNARFQEQQSIEAFHKEPISLTTSQLATVERIEEHQSTIKPVPQPNQAPQKEAEVSQALRRDPPVVIQTKRDENAPIIQPVPAVIKTVEAIDRPSSDAVTIHKETAVESEKKADHQNDTVHSGAHTRPRTRSFGKDSPDLLSNKSVTLSTAHALPVNEKKLSLVSEPKSGECGQRKSLLPRPQVSTKGPLAISAPARSQPRTFRPIIRPESQNKRISSAASGSNQSCVSSGTTANRMLIKPKKKDDYEERKRRQEENLARIEEEKRRKIQEKEERERQREERMKLQQSQQAMKHADRRRKLEVKDAERKRQEGEQDKDKDEEPAPRAQEQHPLRPSVYHSAEKPRAAPVQPDAHMPLHPSKLPVVTPASIPDAGSEVVRHAEEQLVRLREEKKRMGYTSMPPPPTPPTRHAMEHLTPANPLPTKSQGNNMLTPGLHVANYDIGDIHSEGSTDDEDSPKKRIPEWAEGPNLRAALLEQYLQARDPASIFDHVATPKLDDIFSNKKKARWKQRTSSACWAYDSPLREPVKKV